MVELNYKTYKADRTYQKTGEKAQLNYLPIVAFKITILDYLPEEYNIKDNLSLADKS